MYQDRVVLTVKDIYEKEFKLDTRGYRPQEVDKFLDIIMRDYEEFISINKELSDEIKDLTNDNMKLKQEIRSLKMKLDILKESADNDTGSNSVDVLKRLSNLEKIIYGKEYYLTNAAFVVEESPCLHYPEMVVVIVHREKITYGSLY